MKKKTYILLALASFIAVTCSKPSPDGPTPIGPESSKSYIFFEAGILDVAETKVNLLTEKSLPADAGTAFGVIGYYEDGQPIFNSYSNNIANVYRKEKNGVFQYDNLAPWMGTQHVFYAFYPFNALFGSIGFGSDKVPYISYAQPTAENNMIDILGSNLSESQSTPLTPVELKFKHLLWAFNITIKNSQIKELTGSGEIDNPSITIKEVTFELLDFPKSASFKLDADFSVALASETIDPSYTIYSAGTDQIASGQEKTYGPLLFIPVNNLRYRVTVKYATQGGVEGTMVYPASGQYKTLSTGFTPGKVYNLAITKTNDKFFVGIGVEDWDSLRFEHSFN